MENETICPPQFNALYGLWRKQGFTRTCFGDYDGGDAYRSMTRHALTAAFAWAIPSPEAIAWIAERCPRIVEIGAGRGYWAAMLSQAGVDIVAYDAAVSDGAMGENHWHNPKDRDPEPTLWFPVRTGGPLNAADHQDRTLFLCWPPYDDPMAADSLRHYRGRQLLYVGEGDGGCTGCDAFHRAVADEWEEIGDIEIPQWPYIRDHLWLYERK